MNGYDDSANSLMHPPAEPAPTVSKRKPSNRVRIQNLPPDFTQEGITEILSSCGVVKKTSIINAETGPSVNAIFDTPDEAEKAVEKLNDVNYLGSNLKLEIMTNNPVNGRPARPNYANGGRTKNTLQLASNRGTGYPLRIMVPSEYVGAIIGRKGQTIRTITQQCKARVDVHGKENSGLIEKIISIFGYPENCTNACKEILLVMQQESVANGRGEVMLKMLTNDRYCGRIIGKEGKMIKKIRDDSTTKISVSNAQEMAALFPDRVIAIRGSVDGMSQAEAAISAKLAECMEQELQQGGMGPMPLGIHASYYPNSRPPYDAGPAMYAPPPVYRGPPMGGQPPHGGSLAGGMGGPVVSNETCHIAVPNAAVGAIIGTAGSNIKQLMREAGAFVNIESKKEGDPSAERLVTIRGTIDSCWRASFRVFEKMKVEGFGGMDDVRLKTIIRIPKPVVGRIIGKAGKNVRELQRLSGAMIRLPEDPSVQGDEVAVELYGNFLATQTAHERIRVLANQTQQLIYANGGPPAGAVRGAGPRRGPAQQAVEA